MAWAMVRRGPPAADFQRAVPKWGGRKIATRFGSKAFDSELIDAFRNFRLLRIVRLTVRFVRDSLLVMSAAYDTSDRWMGRVLTVTGLLLTLYFSFHLLAGHNGLFALMDLRDRQQALAAELALLQDEKGRIEQRVTLLDQDRLDPDLLEESASISLGFVHSQDLVIFRSADAGRGAAR